MNRQKREQLILDSSLQVFARQGYSQTSVSDLVKQANVSRGTFYLYFKSKKEIFDSLLDRFMGEILHYISLFETTLISKKSIATQSLSHDLANCLTKYRLLARILMLNSQEIDSCHKEKITAYVKQCYRILQFNIDNGIRLGQFKQVPIDIVSRCFIGAIKELLLEWSVEKEAFDLEWGLNQLIEFLVESLGANQMEAQNPLDQDKKYVENDITKSSYI